jgi:hypothetical protein
MRLLVKEIQVRVTVCTVLHSSCSLSHKPIARTNTAKVKEIQVRVAGLDERQRHLVSTPGAASTTPSLLLKAMSLRAGASDEQHLWPASAIWGAAAQ